MDDELGSQPGFNRKLTGSDRSICQLLETHGLYLSEVSNRSAITQVLYAVIQLACKNPEQGFVGPDESIAAKGFSNTKIADILNWPSSESQLKKINKHWNSLIQEDIWLEYEEGFRKRLKDAGQSCTIQPDHYKSEGRTPKRFFLRWLKPAAIEKKEKETRPSFKLTGRFEIKYYLDEKISQGFLLNRFFKGGLKRRGIKHIFVLSVILPLLILWTGLSVISFAGTGTLISLVLAGLALWVFVLIYAWFDRYARGPISPAPWWMQKGHFNNRLLEWRDIPSKSTDQSPCKKDMRLFEVRYSGICPICEGAVQASDGGKEFKGRIVGMCKESPVEHIFSFDPKTCTGYPLREWLALRDQSTR